MVSGRIQCITLTVKDRNILTAEPTTRGSEHQVSDMTMAWLMITHAFYFCFVTIWFFVIVLIGLSTDGEGK